MDKIIPVLIPLLLVDIGVWALIKGEYVYCGIFGVLAVCNAYCNYTALSDPYESGPTPKAHRDQTERNQ